MIINVVLNITNNNFDGGDDNNNNNEKKINNNIRTLIGCGKKIILTPWGTRILHTIQHSR